MKNEVMTSTLIKHIGQKNGPFSRSMTINYWKNKIFSIVEGYVENGLDTLTSKLIFALDDMRVVLYEAYRDAGKLNPEEAEEVYPQVQAIRQTIVRQKNRFEEINYASSTEIKQKFYGLIRLANHFEARVHYRKTMNNDPIPTPSYIKEKARSNSRKAIANGL